MKSAFMLAHIIVSITSFFSPGQSNAVELLKLDHSQACSYYGEKIDISIYSFRSDKNSESIIDQIVRYSGLQQNFVIKSGNVPNATASIIDKERVIVYNQSFLFDIVEKAGTPWAATAILAHEIGHHLNNHTLAGGGSRPTRELEADEFSGHVLYRMGATLEETKAALKLDTNELGSSTHPPKSARLAAITSGWVNARDQDPSAGLKTQDDERVQELEEKMRQKEAEKQELQRKLAEQEENALLEELYDEPLPTTVHGNFCCDPYTGMMVCKMNINLPVGNACSCYMFGVPVTIGQVCN